jgi:hypothetical protein
MPMRPRRRLATLVGFFFVVGAVLLFVVRVQQMQAPTPSNPETAIPDNTSVTHWYPQPAPAPVIIEPAPPVVVPVYPNRDDEHRQDSRESRGHEEHGR